MLFLALRSASLKTKAFSCAALCFFENQSFLALCSASLKAKALFALCSALSQSSFLKNGALKSFLLFVHLQHLINDVSVVGQSWHLVLSAELSFRL